VDHVVPVHPAGDALEPLESLGQRPEREGALHAGESGSNAHVGAVAEGQHAGGLPVEIEGVGVREARGVPVGRGDDQRDLGA